MSDILQNTGVEAPPDQVPFPEEIFEHSHADGPWILNAATNAPEPPDKDKQGQSTFTQWAVAGNDRFLPIGASVGMLQPGIYEAFSIPGAVGVERLSVKSDDIYQLPDMATNTVLSDVQSFWANEAKYREHNLLFKRGIILWGPAGSGKTATIKLLMNELVSRGGIVLLISHAGLCVEVLKSVRRIEPTRHLIAVYEDIDEIIRYNGEAAVLSMLDGEHNVDRILNLASTNHPELLGARIINRPSRFDRRVYVPMPSKEAREQYLRQVTKGKLDNESVLRWTEDTQGLAVAHLRELVASVYCLGQPYEEVLERLHSMAVQIKPEEEFKRKADFGFKMGIPTPPGATKIRHHDG